MALPAQSPSIATPPPGPSDAWARAIRELCPSCGLCCNGVLFANVRLNAREAVPTLRELGAVWESSAEGESFAQPCPAFQGSHCAVYPERPQRCREFHCGLLVALAQGQTTQASALAEIRETQRQASHINALLNQLGNPDPQLPLSRRCRLSMTAATSDSTEELEMRAELMLAVHALVQRLSALFYNDNIV